MIPNAARVLRERATDDRAARTEELDPGWQTLRSTAVWLLVGTFCLFLPSLLHELFADDEIYLAFTNRMVRQLPWTDLPLFLLQPANPWEYLPLRDFTYWLDFRLFGDEPVGFHLSNLVWYALSAGSFCWLLKELVLLFRPQWADRAGVLAVCGTVLFVVHPAHVEAAAWVASRKDLLAGTFGFLSAATLTQGLRSGWPFRHTVVAALLLVLASFSKAAGMTQVLFLTMLIAATWRDSPGIPARRKIATLLLPWVVVACAAIVHLKIGASTGIRIENHPGGWVVLDRASRIFSTLGGLLLWPHPLGLYHDVYRIGAWHWLTSGAGLLLVLLAVRRALVEKALWPVGVILAVTPWVVYLQFIPFTTWSLASERFLFVSVGGLAILLVDVLGVLAQPRRIIALLLLITLPLAMSTWLRVAEWEFGYFLLAREYERQPGFHNAIRDQVLYVLLPKRQYDEAEALARSIPRDYAAAALVAFVGAERALTERNHDLGEGLAIDDSTRRYCLAITSAQRALSAAFSQIFSENDLSYNNFLRSLKRQIELRHADSRRAGTPPS